MPIGADGFDRSVPLPPNLTVGHIRNAMECIEREAEELIDLYYEQANVFSGAIVYQSPTIALSGGRPTLVNGTPTTATPT